MNVDINVRFNGAGTIRIDNSVATMPWIRNPLWHHAHCQATARKTTKCPEMHEVLKSIASHDEAFELLCEAFFFVTTLIWFIYELYEIGLSVHGEGSLRAGLLQW